MDQVSHRVLGAGAGLEKGAGHRCGEHRAQGAGPALPHCMDGGENPQVLFLKIWEVLPRAASSTKHWNSGNLKGRLGGGWGVVKFPNTSAPVFPLNAHGDMQKYGETPKCHKTKNVQAIYKQHLGNFSYWLPASEAGSRNAVAGGLQGRPWPGRPAGRAPDRDPHSQAPDQTGAHLHTPFLCSGVHVLKDLSAEDEKGNILNMKRNIFLIENEIKF